MASRLASFTVVMAMPFLLTACSVLQPSVVKLWSIPVGGYSSSILSGDLVLGSTPEEEAGGEQISAVSLSERRVLWRSEASVALDASSILAADDSAVYIFLNGKGLFIYSRNGTLLSHTPPPDGDEIYGGGFGAGPTLLGKTLLVPNRTHLYAYDVSVPDRPALRWRRTFASSIWSLVATPDGLYVGGVSQSAAGNVLRLSPDTGEEVWRADLQSFGRDNPDAQALVVVDERIVAYSFELGASVQAFEAATGKHLWTAPLDGCSDDAGFVDALEVGGGMVFASPSLGSCLYAVDLTTGRGAWTFQTGLVGLDGAISIGGRPLYHNGVVYTSVERLWALDAATGKVISSASQPAYNTTDTAVHYANGEILVWGDDLTAYRPVR